MEVDLAVSGQRQITRSGVRIWAFIAATALCIGLLVLSGCQPGWRRLAPNDAGFVVSLPEAASCRKWREATSKGELSGRQCEVEVEPRLAPIVFSLTTSYSVSWLDLPGGLEADDIGPVLHELATLAVPAGQQIRKRRTVLDKREAIEFEAMVPVGAQSQHRYYVRERFCVHNNRIYRVSLTGDLDRRRERIWARILESFRFV